MEEVIDKLLSEMDELREEPDFVQIMDVNVEAKLDDPGIVHIDEYPYIYVAPIMEEPISETMGRAGYDVRLLTLQVGIVINASDFFDPIVSELPGSRALIQASSLVRKRLRRLSKRNLDNLQGVRAVRVQTTNYVPDLRGEMFLVRAAIITLTVERQYQHED